MKNIGTLRQLIREILDGLDDGSLLGPTLEHLYKRDKETIGDKVTMESTKRAYIPVLDELLMLNRTIACETPFLVRWAEDDWDSEEGELPHRYVDVCMLNPKYEAPGEGLKPWGCREGKAPPEGYYNANDNKHSKYFALGFTKWSELIDTPIFDETDLPIHEILAEILWELTFYGWTERDSNEKMEDIQKQCERAMKDIDAGRYVELSRTTKDGYDVRIPDSVIDSIKKGLE